MGGGSAVRLPKVGAEDGAEPLIGSTVVLELGEYLDLEVFRDRLHGVRDCIWRRWPFVRRPSVGQWMYSAATCAKDVQQVAGALLVESVSGLASDDSVKDLTERSPILNEVPEDLEGRPALRQSGQASRRDWVLGLRPQNLEVFPELHET